MTDWTDEDALRLDIAMVLSKIETKPRGGNTVLLCWLSVSQPRQSPSSPPAG